MFVRSAARSLGAFLAGLWGWRSAVSVAVGAVLGAVLGFALSMGAMPVGLVWGAAVGAGMGVLVVLRGALVPRWGGATSWAVVALGAGALGGVWVWFVPGCFASVSECARGSLSWSLVGVLWVVLTAVLVQVAAFVVSGVRALWGWRWRRDA